MLNKAERRLVSTTAEAKESGERISADDIYDRIKHTIQYIEEIDGDIDFINQAQVHLRVASHYISYIREPHII